MINNGYTIQNDETLIRISSINHSHNNNWREALDERQKKHLDFCLGYAKDYRHGAIGHNDMILIAALTEMLDQIYSKPFWYFEKSN